MTHDASSFIEYLNKHLNTISSKINIDYILNDKSFLNKYKFFDYCNEYSLIVSSECNFKGCVNSQCVFIIIDQKLVDQSESVSSSNSLLLYIACFYHDSDSVLTYYSFKVLIKSNNKIDHYINRISVNSNGSAVLIYSNDSVYLFTTPELIHDRLLEIDFEYGFLIKEPIKCHNILYPSKSTLINLVKVEWSKYYSNSFLIGSNHLDNHNYSFDNFESNNDSKNDYYSTIQIYNLDVGIEEPIYSFRLSENYLRLGSEFYSNNDLKFQTTMGNLVDVFWNSNDNSDIGSVSLFALSNYGYVFCYCPVILNKSFEILSNLSVFRKCTNLLKNGYVFKKDNKTYDSTNYRNNDNSLNNNDQSFMDQLKECLFQQNELSETLPTVISLVSDDELPDFKLKYSYKGFSSFSVLSTEPLITVALKSNQQISLYEGAHLVNPKTTSFYNPKELNTIKQLKQKLSTELPSKSSFRFECLSKNEFILYSSSSAYHVKYDNNLKINKIYDSSQSNLKQHYSYPIVIKGQTSSSFELGNYSDGGQTSLLFVNKLCLKNEVPFKIEFLLYRIVHNENNKIKKDVTLLPLCSLDLETKKSIEQNPIVFKTEIFEKIRESNQKVNSYSEYFEKIKKLNESTDINEKCVDIIENLSNLNCSVISHLDLQTVYEEALEEYLNRNQKAMTLLDERFKQALEDYHLMFNQMKQRIENINTNNEIINKKRDQLINMAKLLINVKERDESITYVSNMISEFYLRFSNIILTKIAVIMKESEYDPTYESKKQLMIDEWFHDTFKENVGLMHKIFNQIKTIRAGLDSIA